MLSPGVPLTHPKPHWTVEKAKAAFKSAAMGYCMAVIAPVVLTVLQSIIGG